MSVSTSQSKRRRYIRYPIELGATLIVENSVSIPCVIQDFCSGGFFLGFKQSIAEIVFPDHKNITIQFSVSPENGWEDYQLDAKIMHIGANGMGVAVENMPVSAFDALKNEANTGGKNVSGDRRRSSSDKFNQYNFRKEIKKMLDEQLLKLLDHFFECCGEDFIKSKEHTAEFMDRSAHDDLITSLKFSRDSIISEFCNSIFFEVDHISDPRHKKYSETVADGKSLSLIEKEDFEDWLNLSSIIRKLTNHYKNRIHQIEGKLRHVFGSPDHAINNPISPGVLCDNFREIILQLDLNNDANKTLYAIFEKILTNNLGRLYDEFDKVLVNHGAPEQYVPQIIRQPDTPRVERRHNEYQQPDNWQYAEKSQLPALISNDDVLNLLHRAEQKNRQPVAQVARKLLDIVKETNTFSATEVNDGLSEKNGEFIVQSQPVFTADEIVAAISKIQKSASDHAHFHQNPFALQKQLQDTLEHSNTNRKILSTSNINQLEVYGKLFETLFNDLSVSSEIKSYMEKIHLTLLSLTLQGNDLLDSESHPARNVLNQLASLESAVKGNRVIKNTNIKHTLDKLTAKIVQDAGANPDIFREVEQELNEVTAQVTKSIDLNIRRIVEAYEGKQKLKTARCFVQQEIDKRIAGKSIPKIISTLLTSGWQHLLVIIELNQQKNKDEKSKYYQVIDDLMLWLSGQDSYLNEQTGKMIKTVEFIENELSYVCTNVFIHDSFIEELTACLLGTGTPPVRKDVEMISIEPLSIKEGPTGEMSNDKWILKVEQLRVGEWLAILHGTEGFEAMKLVWIGDFPQILVFVNRDGLNKLEFSKNEFAELMRNGAANRIENLDVPLMDRATNTMLQKMHEKLIYNATHDSVTGLFIRDEFVKQLKHEMAIVGNAGHMLCHIEVQDYRMIANSCGVEGANQLLKKLTHLMTGQLRNEELFARLGDKNFGILFKHCSSDEGYGIAKKLVNLISDSHFEWEDKSYSIGVNIGLVPFTGNGYDVNQLLQQADSASISAKRSGHNRIQLFNDEDEDLRRQYKIQEWAGQIDRILSENRLFIRCQKIAAIVQEKNDHTHYEILLGVRDNAGNFIPPDNFIPAVERCKRMPEIDQWIIRHVFGWIEQNRSFFDQMNGFAINLSGQSINTEEFLEFLKELLASSSVPLQKITFEITETVAADSLVYVKKFIKQIKQFGCKFSLDDFGSGYSSYSYLKNLDVDYLKIDGAFIKDIANNKADVAIVKSMNEIAHSLGMETIAEYVENNEICEILREIGVDYVQGYGIQKPVLLTELVVEPKLAQDAVLAEVRSFAAIPGLVEGSSVAEVAALAENSSLTEDAALAENSSKAEDADLAEDISFVDDKGISEYQSFSEDSGLAEDSDFWGF